MAFILYRQSESGLVKLPDDDFPLEKDLQRFVEENIGELLGLRFIATEFEIDAHNRADTLAYDEENNAFVIIEDKNTRNASLVDQGYAYLAAMLDRKAELVLRYNLVTGSNRSVKDFEWSQSRIVFISPSFTPRQIDATSFWDMPFQLFELKRFGDTFSWREVTKRIQDQAPRNKKSDVTEKTEELLSEIKVYTEEDIFPTSNRLYPRYQMIRDMMLELPDVSLDVKRSGIKFKVNGKRICEVNRTGVTKNKFDVLVVNGDEIDDAGGMLIDIKGYEWGSLTHRIAVNQDTNMKTVLFLLEQTYDSVRGRKT